MPLQISEHPIPASRYNCTRAWPNPPPIWALGRTARPRPSLWIREKPWTGKPDEHRRCCTPGLSRRRRAGAESTP